MLEFVNNVLVKKPVRISFLTILWAIPLLLRIVTIDLYQQIILIVVLAALYGVLLYYDLHRPNLEIDHLLRLLVDSIWHHNREHFRANVMVPDSKGRQLSIVYSYNMEGHVDRKLRIEIGHGCAGMAFNEKVPYMVDLTKEPHDKYRVDPSKIWKSMKTMLSCPIIDFEKEKVMGVLNVDTDLDISQAGFSDEKIFIPINSYCDVILEQLKG